LCEIAKTAARRFFNFSAAAFKPESPGAPQPHFSFQGKNMRKSLLMAALAILLALAYFWLGRHQAQEDAKSTPARPSTAETTQAHVPYAADAAPLATFGANDPLADTAAGTNASAAALVMPDGNIAPAAHSAPATPTERRLLGEEGLDRTNIDRLLKDPHFDRVLDGLSREADADSLEMTRLYRQRLDGSFKNDPRFSIKRMQCGAHLCVATATGPVGEDDAFGELIVADARAPMLYGLLNSSVQNAGNSSIAEHRVIFTIDPRYAGIQMRERVGPPGWKGR
jgi:hypothetical protein